jgi:hypothetical protein
MSKAMLKITTNKLWKIEWKHNQYKYFYKAANLNNKHKNKDWGININRV